jgi:hypothetical protein
MMSHLPNTLLLRKTNLSITACVTAVAFVLALVTATLTLCRASFSSFVANALLAGRGYKKRIGVVYR